VQPKVDGSAADRGVRIDLNSAVPATRQIADVLRVELVEGRLRPGDELLLAIPIGHTCTVYIDAVHISKTLRQVGALSL
jgi:hypothetical protein